MAEGGRGARLTRLEEMAPSERRRVEEAWKDAEMTAQEVEQRFRVSRRTLLGAFGPKVRPSFRMRVDGGKSHRLTGNGWAR